MTTKQKTTIGVTLAALLAVGAYAFLCWYQWLCGTPAFRYLWDLYLPITYTDTARVYTHGQNTIAFAPVSEGTQVTFTLFPYQEKTFTVRKINAHAQVYDADGQLCLDGTWDGETLIDPQTGETDSDFAFEELSDYPGASKALILYTLEQDCQRGRSGIGHALGTAVFLYIMSILFVFSPAPNVQKMNKRYPALPKFYVAVYTAILLIAFLFILIWGVS